jgi:protein-tyrosine phosphatase
MIAREIIPHIWLCDFKNALDKDFIINKNISIIINCSKNLPFIKLSYIKKYRLPVNDSMSELDETEMVTYLPEIISVLESSYSQSIPTIIHCYSGRQRSATVIAALLICTTNMDPLNAIRLIQTKCPETFRPNINFYNSLLTYSKLIKN